MSGEGAALTFLLQMLRDVFKDYSGLKKGAKYEIDQLQNELYELFGYLQDAASMPRKTNAFKQMEMKLKKVVYEVEDTIETYFAKKAAKKRNLWGKIKGGTSTAMERMVKDLRDKKVVPALEYFRIPRPPKEGETAGNSNSETTSDGVELTYRDLDYHKKMCFLYTGLFPEDYEIPASTLTQLWIAEKFIHTNGQMSLEETAKGHLRDLVSKGLLVAKRMRLDEVKTCQVDAASRDFCINKAKEELLLTVIGSSIHEEPKHLYRVCFHSNPSTFLARESNWPNVRSFLCLVREPLRLKTIHISTIPKAFKPLRILNCTSTKFEELPKITSLILLKHVSLSIDKLESLPEEISKLVNLQTLKVETEGEFINVQVNIWKMTELRHLKTKVSFVLMDDKKRKGTIAPHDNLQTISRLSTKSCSTSLHEKAPKLKSLGIRGELYDFDMETMSLQKFHLLEKLKLENYQHFGLTSGRPFVNVPRHDRFPSTLKRITLLKTYLVWDTHMTILAKINNLEILKVKESSFKGAVWSARTDDEFRKLNYLLIDNTDLRSWSAHPSQFPELKCLVIKNCVNFQNVPESLKTVNKLEVDLVSRNQ